MRSFQKNKNNPRFHPLKMWVTMVVVALTLVFCGFAYADYAAKNLYAKDGDSFVLNGEEIRL